MSYSIFVRKRDDSQWFKFAEFESFNKALKMTYKVVNKYPQLRTWIKLKGHEDHVVDDIIDLDWDVFTYQLLK